VTLIDAGKYRKKKGMLLESSPSSIARPAKKILDAESGIEKGNMTRLEEIRMRHDDREESAKVSDREPVGSRDRHRNAESLRTINKNGENFGHRQCWSVDPRPVGI
jgi:hypothetical protein